MVGSHVAQVLVIVHGDVPGIAASEAGATPAVKLPGGNLCWPMSKAHNRLVNGGEDNLWHYYLAVSDQLAHGASRL